MNGFEYIIKRAIWKMGLIYVPEWDNSECIFHNMDVLEIPDNGPRQERPPTKTFNYGVAKPGETQELIQYVETESMNEDGPIWDLARFDGTAMLNVDFSDWDRFDDYVCNKRKFNETDMANYILVRPYLLQRKTNKWLMEHFDKGKRWAEKYGAAGREMIKLNIEAIEAENLSPIE